MPRSVTRQIYTVHGGLQMTKRIFTFFDAFFQLACTCASIGNTFQNYNSKPKAPIFKLSISLFIRNYLRNPIWFIFHRLLICLVRGLGRAPPMPHMRATPEMFELPVPEALAEAGYHEGSVFSELSEFVADSTGLRPVPVSARDGKVAVMMGLAAQESIRTGHAVSLNVLESDGKGGSIPSSRL